MPENTVRFIKSYPGLMNTPIWQDDATFKLYHFFLYKANVKDRIWRDADLSVGEIPLSQRGAAKELHWSVHKLQRHMKALQMLQVIHIRISDKGTIVRVLDYGTCLQVPVAPPIPFSCSHDELAPVAMIAPKPSHDDHTPVATAATPCSHGSNTSVATIATNRGNGSPADVVTVAPYIDSNKNTSNIEQSNVDDEQFLQLWLAYPEEKRNGRQKAKELYRSALQNGATHEAIMEALEAAIISPTWNDGSGLYIPGIVTWLEKETWRTFVRIKKESEEEEWVSE